MGGAAGSGGVVGTGGKGGTGGGAATGGTTGTGGLTGTGGTIGAGGTIGTGGTTVPITGPCDIYAAANPATPCVAAYSMARVLASSYGGPLYQVRKGAGPNNTGTGGTTTNIGYLPGGFADAAAQDAFWGAETCTVSKLYDHRRGSGIAGPDSLD